MKTLSFHRQKFGLEDSTGNFVSLAALSSFSTASDEKSFWQNLPWQESEIASMDLGDLPCRLSGSSLALALQKFWLISQDDAVIKLHLPHPRHDLFLNDLGYVRGLLPETFSQLDPRQPDSALANQLGVRYEILGISIVLDPHWQNAMNEKKITFEDIRVISRQASNVIEWTDLQLQVKKSLWVEQSQSPIDESMRKQLNEQLQAHVSRGDEKAAGVIRQFLANASNRPPAAPPNDKDKK